MDWSAEDVEKFDRINGDRRQDRRYRINLDLRWKLIRRRRVLDSGVGRTVDLSSGGILFDPGRTLPVGLNVELAISWPVLLRNEAPMQLIVSGRIVRAAHNRTALAMNQHEFRTSGTLAENRMKRTGSTPAPPPAQLANGTVGAAFGKYR
ncbi:MAG TPA: PilZ domain-containing protein [Bryobacteraceae bacterium]|nr:PilZ domain-containing protein [Bryobacteraceae bacterium]